MGYNIPSLRGTWILLPLLSADDFLQGFYADYVPFFILSLTSIWSQGEGNFITKNMLLPVLSSALLLAEQSSEK